MQLGYLPRIKLTELPAPLEELSRLTQALGGPKLLVKRDDLTSLGLGGNKVRKLEFLLADTQNQGATAVISTGGPQTNHGRITIAAAIKLGMKLALKDYNRTLCIPDYQPVNGMYEAPNLPGLGIELNDEVVSRSPRVVVK